ncbi:UvrD-helicase domain-containing protein, partial [Actinotalea sp.]|uniref:UvrD-helicase domain-containing protein n=1 Tax=Actinotalea sp. TaxID=1872145 RepID=UPI0035692FD3
MPPGRTVDGEPVVDLVVPGVVTDSPGPVTRAPGLAPSVPGATASGPALRAPGQDAPTCTPPPELSRLAPTPDLPRLAPTPEVPRPAAAPGEPGPAPTCGVLTAPTERWGAHLDAHQSAVVRARLDGPALICGAVGTGKTVVGLHRAVHLARTRPGRVLLTALAPSLTAVLRQHVDHLAPDVAERIDVLALPAVALRVLRERGVRLDLHPVRVGEAFDEAWRSVGRRGLLAHLAPERSYWEQEIAEVLRAQGPRSLEEYLALPRTGRLHRLGPSARQAVWALHEATTGALRRRQVHALGEVALLVEDELRRAPLAEPWAAVLVDDAQELSATMLRVVRLLSPGGGAGGVPPIDLPDALTLIGDPRLPLHPGGSTLAEAGIDVAGRTLTLRLHQRSTAPILHLAGGLLPAPGASTLAGPVDGGAFPRTAPRAGPEPVLVRYADA